MTSNKSCTSPLKLLTITGCLSLGLALTPTLVMPDQFGGIAIAKNDGKGGGKGGGNGGGNSAGNGKSAAAHSGHRGNSGKSSGTTSQDPLGVGQFVDRVFGNKSEKSHKHANSGKKAKSTAVAKVESGEKEIEEAKIDGKLPGKLNAAHASATARAHAAPNSAVGRIAAYEQAKTEALASGDEQAIADANDLLRELTNKELDDETIATLDKLLGIEAPIDADADELAEAPTDDVVIVDNSADDLAEAPTDDIVTVQ